MTVILVCVALAGFALLYSLWVPRNEVVTPEPVTQLDYLRQKKKIIYDNLRDLNFEYRTGKLSDEDYQQAKTSLQYEMALLMKTIEEEERRDPAAAARSRQVGRGPRAAAVAEAENDAEESARSARSKAPAAAAICPKCGASNPSAHKHCSECGARLAMALAALVLMLALCSPAMAQKVAVEGVATNLTQGKPAAGLQVALVRADESKRTLGEMKTDREGRFKFAPVDLPPPPALLMVQTVHGGVRYSEPTDGSRPLEIKLFDAGAPPSTIHVADRAVIMNPRAGRLEVNELYLIRNESNPPAAFAPTGGSFRFFVAPEAHGSLQVSMSGAAGMPIPVETRPDPAKPGALALLHALKPGENRLEVVYTLDYPGNLVFDSQWVDPVERTRLAVAGGVTVQGQGVTFVATEPQSRFGIYDVARGDRWSVTLSGVAAGAAGAEGAEGEAAGSGDRVAEMPGAVAGKTYYILAGVLAMLAVGFVRLWRAESRSEV